jgi:hypothetical protein
MTSKSITTSKRLSRQSPLKWSPLPYMRRAVKFLLEHGAAILMLDPGLRKTSITLAAFSFLKKQGVARKMLVIAPLKACYQVWPAEVAKWKDFNHLRIVVLHGPKKEQLLQQDADVYVINPEGLEWLVMGARNCSRHAFSSRRWAAFAFDTLAIDELTKFKHSRGVRFKVLKLVLGTFTRRWGLTGSPAANGLLDLFGQCYVIDMGNALGQFITHYRFKYFYNPDGQGWKWVLQSGAKERYIRSLNPSPYAWMRMTTLTCPKSTQYPYSSTYPLMRAGYMTNLRMIWLLRLNSVSLQPPTLPRQAGSFGRYVMADSTWIMTLLALSAVRKERLSRYMTSRQTGSRTLSTSFRVNHCLLPTSLNTTLTDYLSGSVRTYPVS